MSTHPGSPSPCCCSRQASTPVAAKPAPVKKAARSLPSILLSVLIAFFPKCPMCWAAYMSMFGSIGLAEIPYMSWLFPVLLGFMGLHLFLLLRKRREKGYGPFLLSLGGALVILGARYLFPGTRWLMFAGMLLIVSGSLWNSFSFSRPKISFR